MNLFEPLIVVFVLLPLSDIIFHTLSLPYLTFAWSSTRLHFIAHCSLKQKFHVQTLTSPSLPAAKLKSIVIVDNETNEIVFPSMMATSEAFFLKCRTARTFRNILKNEFCFNNSKTRTKKSITERNSCLLDNALKGDYLGVITSSSRF